MILPTKVFWSPLSLILDPTDICNYRCIMCRPQFIKGGTIMWSYQDYLTVTEKFSPRSVSIGGTGEPLLNKELSRMIENATGRGIKVIINTNGSLLDRVMDHLSHISVIKVSLDTHNAEMYKRIRRSDGLEEICGSIKKIVALRGPPVRLEYVVMSVNYRAMAEFVSFTKALGASGAFFRLYEGGQLPEELNRELMNVPGIGEEIKRALLTAKELGVQTNLPDLHRKIGYVNELYADEGVTDDRKKRTCLLPWVQLFIRADGETAPCCDLLELGQFSVGNVFKQENVWNSEEMVELRRAFLRKENYDEFDCCKTCEYLDWRQILRWTRLVPKWFV